MNRRKIKEIAEKSKKKIGKEAIKKLENYIEERIEEIITRAARNSDFFGRKVIKKEDLEF